MRHEMILESLMCVSAMTVFPFLFLYYYYYYDYQLLLVVLDYTVYTCMKYVFERSSSNPYNMIPRKYLHVGTMRSI